MGRRTSLPAPPPPLPRGRRSPAKPFPKGHTGRPKGSKDKVPQDLKRAIVEAANKAGGRKEMVGYLTWAAKKYPVAFLGLLGRVLPLQVNAQGDISITVTRRIVDANDVEIVPPPVVVIDVEPEQPAERDPEARD